MKAINAGALIGALAVAGCATTPDPGAEVVRVTASEAAARGCRFLGQETVVAHSMPVDITTRNAITSIKNRAVARGGNLVVSAGPQITMPGPAATMSGDIYAC